MQEIRDDFPTRVRTKIAQRVGSHCSNPNCPRPWTHGPQLDPEGAINLGVAAHITAASPEGPRYDSSLNVAQRSSAENGIWLCQSCAKLIDSDVRAYTVELLRDWKTAAETRARSAVQGLQEGRRRRRPVRLAAALAAALAGAAVLFVVAAELFARPGQRFALPLGIDYVVGDGFERRHADEAALPAHRAVVAGRDVTRRTRPGTYFRDCPDCPLMVVLPAGRFVMGASPGDGFAENDERPPRSVTVAAPFAMSVYETTFREWDAGTAAGALPGPNAAGEGVASDEEWGRGNRPVINVTFDHAQAYVHWLNRRLGRPIYRLPSEAEWEYGARAGAATRYSFGDTYDYDQVSDGPEKTEPVGSYSPNRFGLYDMQGNVWEWTSDCWHDSYRGAPPASGSWTAGGDCTRRSIRGGSWGKEPNEMRVSNRYPSGGQGYRLGFRVARDLPSAKRPIPPS